MQEGGLIKTKKFKHPKYVGDPINAVKIFNEKEVDELILLDITAWKKGGPNYNLLEKIAVESRMPLCYGGGVTRSEQALRIVNMGFEKVSISRAAVSTPDVIGEMASKVGNQSVVVTLDVRKNSSGSGYSIYVENGGRCIQHNLIDFCHRVIEAGAGELVINSIDLEGELKGYDLDLARMVAKEISIPVTFIGGAGRPDDMAKLIDEVGIVGAAAGSMFVFKGPFRAVLISYSRPELVYKNDPLPAVM
jgi:cyclase